MSEARRRLLSFQDGARAVELARDAMESYVQNGQREQPGSMRDAFYARTGAFVRLESNGRLRGCAGDTESTQQLGHAIVDAAIEATSKSSCRSEIESAELDSVAVSVHVVGDLVPTEDPANDLQIGRHGVLVEGGGERGCLYPTVPLDNGWSTFEYLDRTCRKAGLPKGAWEDDDVTVSLIEGQVFRERTPRGDVQSLD